MKIFISLFISFFIYQTGLAQNSEPILLYAQVPNSKPTPADYVEKNDRGWITRVSLPTLTPYFPTGAQRTSTAVIVIPGGGYAGLAANHEGADVAKRFADSGITAFVLKYRLPSDVIMVDRTIGPLQDAQRAIQIVREHAGEWKIDTNRIGVIGFSAGGHLASTVGTHYDQAVIENKKGISLRPDFMALIYPVISMTSITHAGSKENLIGKSATDEQVTLYSNEKQIKASSPPAFLIHAADDKVVPVQNSLQLYEAIIKAGAKAEMHLYEAGGHGFGMFNKTTPDEWFPHCLNWLRANNLLVK